MSEDFKQAVVYCGVIIALIMLAIGGVAGDMWMKKKIMKEAYMEAIEEIRKAEKGGVSKLCTSIGCYSTSRQR